MERKPTYQMQIETWPLDQGAREREDDIRGADKAKAEEDLREVRDKLFATTMEVQDTMHEIVQTWHACRADTIFSLTMGQNTSLY